MFLSGGGGGGEEGEANAAVRRAPKQFRRLTEDEQAGVSYLLDNN